MNDDFAPKRILMPRLLHTLCFKPHFYQQITSILMGNSTEEEMPMLNENHAFILDFPDFKLDIVQLNHDDPTFKADLQQYHELDYKIRQLEVLGSPIDDDNMHNLKLQRMELKDMLYQQLTKHHEQVSD